MYARDSPVSFDLPSGFVTSRRFPLRRAWIAGLLLAASFVGALVTPGVVHVHTGGDAPHSHNERHSHTHSHGPGHSHSHSHSHPHRHSHHYDDVATGKAASSQPHVHVSFLGWEFTLTLPNPGTIASRSPQTRLTPPALPQPFAPRDTEGTSERLEDSRTDDVPMLEDGIEFFAADETTGGGSFWNAFSDCWKPAPVPGRVDLAVADACGGRIELHDDASMVRPDEPAVPPPRA
jgi:hypothetical protein